MKDEPQEEKQATPQVPFSHRAMAFGSIALTACGLDALVSGPPPLAIAGLVAAGVVAYNMKPEWYDTVREHATFLPERKERKDGEYSIGDKLLGRHLNARPASAQTNETGPDTEPLPKVNNQQGDTEPAPAIPPQFTLGRQALAAIKEVNEKRFVYFGRAATREVVIPIDDMYHVLDVAKSGRGKSNRFRNGMMQMVNMADTYYLNPFAAPVKSVTDARRIEVWQPIYDRLANGHPVRESAEILQVLTDLVHEIEVRSDQEQVRDFSWRRRPIFIFIDEVPEINARCPDAVKLLDRIGRGGRQFGVFAWVATQSALVQDIGLSTASQAQFKTLIYGGGDKTSGNRVLGSVTLEQEKALKKSAGLTLMIGDGVEDDEYVRAPLITNEALFAFLGLPPFQIDEWLVPTSTTSQVRGVPTSLPTSERRTPLHLVNGREVANEAGRSGREVAEVAEVATATLSEREIQIAEMFFVHRMNPGAIARELSGGKGGDAFQKISLEVADAIRKYVEVQRGA